MPAKLDALRESLDSLEELVDPEDVEPTLDAIASSLKGLLEGLPVHLKRRATSLDELLAYLASKGRVPSGAVQMASRLLESASVEGYDWVSPSDEFDERARNALLESLRDLYDWMIEDELGNDDEGT